MKKLLPISVVAIFAIAPTFADNEPTLIPANNPGCTNSVLHTTTGPASLEAIYTANTINTTWFSNGTQLSGNGVPATCTYNTPILPPTPANRPGYAFNGWRLRNPLLSLDTTIDVTDNARIELNGDASPDNQTVASYGLTDYGTGVLHFSYGDIYVESSCNSTSVSGGDTIAALVNLQGQIQSLSEEEQLAQRIQMTSTFNFVTRPSNTFTRGANGDNCWCRVYGYKPTNGTLQSTPSAQWVMIGDTTPFESDCEAACIGACTEFSYVIPHVRATLYGQ